MVIWLPQWLSCKESTCQCRRHWVGKIPWRRKWQPTPVFLPGKSYGQRSLAGYSSWDCKELDTIERARTHTQSHTWSNEGRSIILNHRRVKWEVWVIVAGLTLTHTLSQNPQTDLPPLRLTLGSSVWLLLGKWTVANTALASYSASKPPAWWNAARSWGSLVFLGLVFGTWGGLGSLRWQVLTN